MSTSDEERDDAPEAGGPTPADEVAGGPSAPPQASPAAEGAQAPAASTEPRAADEAPLRPRGARLVAACVVAIVALLAADLLTKRWAEGRLSLERTGERPAVCAADETGAYRYQRVRRPPLVLVDDVFELEYAENCGAAFGILRTAPAALRGAVFDTAAIVASLALLFFFVTGRGGSYFAWSVPFVVAGAVGNLVDRVVNGYVVDFIHFHVGNSFDYPTFNVADIVIAIGVALLVVDGFQRPQVAPGPAPAAAPSPTT